MLKAFLIVLVFVGGMTSLALEMSASRLLGAYFGTSLYIWGCLIGLILLYLTMGYFLGGRLADRHPSESVLCTITAIAAIAILIIPFASKPILSWSITAMAQISVSIFLSSLVGTMLLFAIPVTLLGFVSPFAIRLITKDIDRSGRMSGSLYAISTIGSLLGAFLPVLWFIPTFGVRRTILIFGVLLFAASLWGLRPPDRHEVRMQDRGQVREQVRGQAPYLRLNLRPAFILALIVLFLPLDSLKSIPNQIYAKESLYNYIQVTQQADGTRQLILNEGQAVHSIYSPDPNQILTGWYWDYFLAAPYFNPDMQPDKIHRVGIIGLAAGTIARQFTRVYGPQVQIDGVEIDPDIVAVGRKYFDMNEPNLHVYTQDGRTFLSMTHQRYDVVAIDVFDQPYIPFQFTTREFFTQVRDHMTDTGTVVLNTAHTTHDYRLVQAFVNTMKSVFPSVYTFNVPNTFNTEIMATKEPTTIATFQKNLARLPPEEGRDCRGGACPRPLPLRQVASEVLPVARDAHPDGGLVFTDDHSPIEQITDQLLLNYIQQP
jgi:spermidine synthase